MYESNKVWDVEEDGSVRRSSLVLESRQQPGALQTFAGRAGPGTAVAAYAGTGGALAWWWGSSGVMGFLGSAAFWPVLLGFKALAFLFWPVLLAGAAGTGGWLWLKNRGRKSVR